MAERATLNQVTQIGVEATPGTAVAATRRLQSISIEPSPSVELDAFRPQGSKYTTITSVMRDWTEGSLSGRMTYNELVYVLSSVVTTATITTPTGATNARKWTFSPSTTADDSPKIYTVEHGAAGAATNNGRFTYGLFTEFSFSFSRDSAPEVGGSLMGRKYEVNFGTMSATTTIDPVPIQGTEITVYFDTTRANVHVATNPPTDTYKLKRLVSGEFNLGSRFGPVWVVDAANPGFVAHVETEPDATWTMTIEADSQYASLLANARNSDTLFFRVRAVGAEVETGQNYEFILDFACKIADVGDFSDEDGVYAGEFTCQLVHDSDWGKAYEFVFVNGLAAL